LIRNEKADALAKKACELDHRHHGSFANARRRMKEKAQQGWVEDWKRKPNTGRFAVANRIPPSLKPTDRFNDTPREIFGRSVQCRVGHAFMGEYYDYFNIPEGTTCPCGEQYQTREHILRDCRKYNAHRHILRDISPSISLAEILGTTDIRPAHSQKQEKREPKN
jgi:hypothetical protein